VNLSLPLLTTAPALGNGLYTALVFGDVIIEAFNANLVSYDITDPLHITQLAIKSPAYSEIATDGNNFYYCDRVTQRIGLYDKNLSLIGGDVAYASGYPQVTSLNDNGHCAFTDPHSSKNIYVYSPDLTYITISSPLAGDISKMMCSGGLVYYTDGYNKFVSHILGGTPTTYTCNTITTVTCFSNKDNLIIVGGVSVVGDSILEFYDASNQNNIVFLYSMVFSFGSQYITNMFFDSSKNVLCCGTSQTAYKLAVYDFISGILLVSTDGSGVNQPAFTNKYINGKILSCGDSLFSVLDATSIKNYEQYFIDLTNNATIKNTIRLNSVVNHTRPISLLGKYKS
jgi:hypothetical protein